MASEREDLRVGGMRLWARFSMLMAVALAVVMTGAGFFLFSTSSNLAKNVQEQTLVDTIKLSAQSARIDQAIHVAKAERDVLTRVDQLFDEVDSSGDAALSNLRDEVRALKDAKTRDLRQATETEFWKQVGGGATRLDGGSVLRANISYGPDDEPGILYRLEATSTTDPYTLLMPANDQGAARGLLGLIVGVTILVILVGAGVSVFVANQVSGPLEEIVQDVRQISTGDLNHRTRAKGGGEIALLARSIDRMTKNLSEAQDAELELQIRDREVEVAAEVRESLLPQSTPTVAGYTMGGIHMSSAQLGGDFHDYIEIEGDERGRVGLLVCDVSGDGLPGALVGAMARSYLKAELQRGGDLTGALQDVNRKIARDVRRGIFVTALYVLLDPAEGTAEVACAGHKIPLVRVAAEDGKVRLLQPEGIALGFDKGPIFDRALQVEKVPLDPGDRIVLATTGAVAVQNPEGEELSEKPLYAHVMRHAKRPTDDFLQRMQTVIEAYADGMEFPKDVSIVTLARDA